MRVWREGELPGEGVLEKLLCDLCGEQVAWCQCDPGAIRHYKFARLYFEDKLNEPKVDIDICDKCIYEKIMPLTLIEKGH